MNETNYGDEYPSAGCKKLESPIDWPTTLAVLAIVAAILAAVIGL